MAKISRPVLYLAIIGIGAAAYIVMNPDTPAKTSTKPKTHARITTANSQFLPVDYSTTFDAQVPLARNAFKPLVERRSSALLNALAAGGAIPPELTGGDANWVCTGSAEVDGIKQALLENKNSGDAVFVKQGDHWKNAVVSQVLDEAVVLVGDDGEPRTIHVQQDQTSTATADTGADAGTLPIRPQLNGVIGGNSGAQIQPLPAPTDTTSQTDNINAG